MRIALTILLCSSFWSDAAMSLRDAFYVSSLASGSAEQFSLITNIVTDLSVTPSTNAITLANDANAVRILSGEHGYTSDGGFTVYVSDNGFVTPVRMYNWQGRIYQTTNGANLSFGTDDGSSIQIAPMKVPASLPTATGTSNLVTIDKAGPPLWSPQNAHVTLPAYNSAFTVHSNLEERVIFISEQDGTTWSKPRFYWVQSNYNITIQATYKKVAICAYDGQPLAISAPSGSTLGGTSNYMTIPLPAVTGTTRNVTNGYDLLDAFTNLVSGDRIVLWGGWIYVSNNIVTNMFPAAYASGKMPFDGVQMTSGETTNVVITGSDTNLGAWTIRLDPKAMTGTAYVKNVTFDWSATPNGSITNKNPFYVVGGKWIFENVTWKGPTVATAGGNCIVNVPSTAPIYCDFLWCQNLNGASDNWSHTGDSTYSSTSLTRYIGCISTNPGPSASDQCFTTHVGMSNFLYGCFASGSSNNVIANGDDGARTFANFCQLDPGPVPRRAQVQHTALFGCTVTNQTGQLTILTNHYALFNKLVGTNFSAAIDWYPGGNSIRFSHNRITASVGRALHSLGNRHWFIGNIMDGAFGQAVRVADTTGSREQTNTIIWNNTILDATTAFYLYQSSTLPSNIVTLFTNNATAANGTGLDCSVDSRTNIWSDYNTIDPTVAAAFTVLGANDTTNANASLTANYFPTASGNCDGTGATNLFGWEGDSDPYGFVLIYSRNRGSRGAREIPAIYAGSKIYPDIW